MAHTHASTARGAYTRRSFVTVGALGSLTLAACSSGTDAAVTEPSAPASSSTPTPTPSPSSAKPFEGTVEVLPLADAVEVNPLERVRVTTADSTLTKVTVTTVEGEELPGALAEDGKSWESTENMLFQRTYTVTWEATDAGEATGAGESIFSTVSAAYEADAIMNIEDGATYGIGQILQFNFSEPVLNKAEVEKHITVTGGGDQPGAFRWYSDYMVRYRPQDKWATNSTYKVTVDIFGLDIGNGMIGNHTTTRTFHTWNKRYALADDNTKTIKIYIDDKLVRENAITLGNAEWPSVVGQLPIIEKAESYYFNPSSLDLEPDDPHYYEPFWASWTSRLTNGGVFVHQALPTAWSSVGVANVSHGCIGMLPEDVKFFYDTFGVGDIVETVNTGYPQADPDDGYGDWNIPFEHYRDSNWRGNW
ncbi:MAG: Ig-like domain-containing protein [Rothia sp. (in: high G+C Gram-positive bacteria)]|nr:Ig-like domain-containing protein [Rothia sp. (in: high G+C Gram-positive bacteria)]